MFDALEIAKNLARQNGIDVDIELDVFLSGLVGEDIRGFMTWRRDSPLERIMRTSSSCSGSSPISMSRLVVPMIPFIGVRISWLMLARKLPLAAVAVSA